MKKLLVLISILLLTLTGCGTQNSPNEDIDLTTLPYHAYLSETNPVVTITVKDIGVMKLQLFPDVAKNTVNNFINYIQNKSYTGSSFHRIVEDFMIQGGIVSDTNCPIEGEFASNNVTNNLFHSRGVISMARTIVNNSATSQFFIMHKDYPSLNREYAAFGGLVSGFNVLDQLATLSTKNQAPIDKVVIKSITVQLNGYVVGDVICAN